MGRRRFLTSDSTRRTAEEVSDILREAAWGLASWQDVCRMLAKALPGSAPTIVNYDLANDRVRAAFAEGMDPAYLESYRDYYVALNPWMEYWQTAPLGAVKVSEQESPARQFRDSEFYVDWLAPQKNVGAAVGVRLAVDPANTIQLSWHYEEARAAQYDARAAAVLELVKPTLVEALRVAGALRREMEGGRQLGSLIERIDGAAVMVDRERRIRETNAEAQAMLSLGAVAHASNGILGLREQAAQRWFEDVVLRLADRVAVTDTEHIFSIGERIFRVSVTLAPEGDAGGFPRLLRPRASVLVVLRLLVGGRLRLDDVALRFAFGLSSAEMKLCEALVNGNSLSQAARRLGLSDGTVRQRVKMVFHKTHTHRQGELIAALMRFCVPE